MFPIYDFVFDEDNTDKLGRRGIDTEQVLDMLDNRFVTRRNRKNRRAPYLFVGTDHGGRCITLPIQPTDQLGVWRPVTGWYSKANEAAWLDQ